MKGRRSSVKGAGSRCGRASVVIGTFSSYPGGVFVFRGLSLPRVCFALGVAAGQGRRLNLRELGGRLTECPVLRPSGS